MKLGDIDPNEIPEEGATAQLYAVHHEITEHGVDRIVEPLPGTITIRRTDKEGNRDA